MKTYQKLWIIIGSALVALVIMFALLPQAEASGPKGDETVEVSDFEFTPYTVTITAGEMVVWNNVQGFHNVRSDEVDDKNNPLFTSGAPNTSNWTFEHTFDTAGVYRYYCEPHGAPGGLGMSGVVIVESPPTAVTLTDLSSTESNPPFGWWALSVGLVALGMATLRLHFSR